MQLSKNFILEELVRSQTATRLGIKEQFTPPAEVVENLKMICENILEPVRVWNRAGFVPSSGYRCPKLNKVVKGKPSSQHLKGEAVDIDLGRDKNVLLLNWIKDNLKFDQLINEYPDEKGRPSWVHVSLKKSQNRGQVITID
jgi:zinc D-Ala-D-Ala carboxypeptidase